MHTMDSTLPQDQLSSSGLIGSNGVTQLRFSSTTLEGPDRTKLEGEETFTILSLENGRGTNPVLESAKVQIWPIADGVIEGLDATRIYNDVPRATVVLKDLYPDSTTHVRVYRGAPSQSPAEAVDLPTSYVVINDVIPQDRNLSLDELDRAMNENGSYTLEVIHQTPFGAEILTRFYPIQVRRKIAVRGTLFGLD